MNVKLLLVATTVTVLLYLSGAIIQNNTVVTEQISSVFRSPKKDVKINVFGTIHNPKSGKNHNCRMNLCNNTFEVRGYIGISLFDKTETYISIIIN
ncbi:DUF2147 domain-containing protein [Flavobacterium silvisoli]|uniref:DUF2147 domain-containing protein n=1 Tax=Flavobacterium silvisoli TaxID=2529433 RepID=A0A4Q9Z2H2_9FLAO|nr:DUF2147 domain-containing protein [Flavobacterium silvisoli]TBX70310.1 DUF2147 domain-containing protein [Flavobacterium silvisoli]